MESNWLRYYTFVDFTISLVFESLKRKLQSIAIPIFPILHCSAAIALEALVKFMTVTVRDKRNEWWSDNANLYVPPDWKFKNAESKF